MRRIGYRSASRVGAVFAAAAFITILGGGARAQEPTPPGSEPAPPGTEPAPPATEPTTPTAEPSPPGNEPTAPGAEPSGPAPSYQPGEGGKLGSLSWRDILVVPRRPILKYHRIELVPTYNITINSPVERHHGFGGIANFFLSETLSIALEATYYQNQDLEHFFLRGLDDRVLPSVNRYLWSATANFGYVPMYGKFAIFDRWIFQWEAYVQAGIGVIQTRWITRDPGDQTTDNFNVLWHIDIGTRLFLTKWLVIHAYLKDYMFVDKFEPSNRTTQLLPPESQWVSQFVNNIVFGVGVGMFLPTNFEYKYTR